MGNTISYNVAEHKLDLGDGKGSITGLQYDTKARRYAGVPYALPPLGDLRWRKPQPLPADHTYTSHDGTPFDATKFGPICPQAAYMSAKKIGTPEEAFGEDCLRLNIWTPVEAAKDKKWPVMLWLHGGWFQMGDPSHEPGMDPTELISTGKLNAIVVAIGYRLNLFGFLAGDALQAENGSAEAGNYGLWDQRLAIDWVRENIARFGGDVENITLAGRSAGAYAVHAHAMYEFQNPAFSAASPSFHRIVMMSNAIPAQPKTPAECQSQFDELCQFFDIPEGSSGAEKLALLRRIESKKLVDAIMKLKNHTFRPVTDSSFIQPGMMDYHRNGTFAEEFKKRNFKIIIGEMLNEETLYAATNGPEANVDSLRLQVSNYYAPATTSRVLKHYKLPDTDDKSDWTAVYGHIISDGQVRAPSRFLANSLFSNGVGVEDIWRYRISYRLSFITDAVAPRSFGVAHAMDKPFWNFSIMHGPTEQELVLMTNWIRDLVAFVGAENDHRYGPKEIDEFKVATPEGKIEIQKDTRWKELLELADIFSG
ncbi:uncharacterized protein EAE98_010305 [Botrytis deweyae]|uniref:Carboxylic ester hydrolase n=2 Tax=Botrytis TaxID=33196 RepID=A0A4Z1JJS1_9HELO|nr:uncharacterized protein EAE98_010305 [Botrytis deweyae]KAF7917200.1 hypothetical protein EAE98_010305 [Botrytis deweyae]KAF7923917.1 hypothetical protein EAE99_006578 [Botrytis elliptica]TGO73818.1 hypothetical protein BELL_0329g00100 [Botrytis elliptica]